MRNKDYPKLRSCPFCGREAIKGKNGHGNWIGCSNSECYVQTRVFWTEDEAIHAWNTRAKDENPVLTLDELKQTEDSPLWIVDKERGIQGHRLCGDCDYPAFNGFFSMGIDGREYIHDYQDYGKTWLAYRRKLEGEEVK